MLSGLAHAQNEGLAQRQAVPVGERVANYLQGYLAKVGAIVEAKSSGGLLEGVQTYRIVVDYDPERKVIEVTVIGMSQDPKAQQDMLGTIKDIIVKANPRFQKNFGVTLQESDLSMDYIHAKTGQVLMRFRAGKYEKVVQPKVPPSHVSTATTG